MQRSRKSKRKNRSSDFSSNSSNLSATSSDQTTTVKENKRQRSNSARQTDLIDFVSGDRRMAASKEKELVPPEKEDGSDLAVSDQLHKINKQKN